MGGIFPAIGGAETGADAIGATGAAAGVVMGVAGFGFDESPSAFPLPPERLREAILLEPPTALPLFRPPAVNRVAPAMSRLGCATGDDRGER